MDCTVCKTCAEHCRLKDPIACAQEAVDWAQQHLGPDDPRTKTVREQLDEARLNMRALEAARRARAMVLESRRRRELGPKKNQKPN